MDTNMNTTYANSDGDGEAILVMFSTDMPLQSLCTITLPVDRHPLKFEIDTGATVILISDASLPKFPHILLARSTWCSYSITPNGSTDFKTAELMFKRQLHTRLNLLNPSMHDKRTKQQTKMKARYDAHTQPRILLPSESVYTKLELEANWYSVTVQKSEGQIVEIGLEDGRIMRQHLDQVHSQTETESEEFGKFKLSATLDANFGAPLTEVLRPKLTTTPPAEVSEEPVTPQNGAEFENTTLGRST
ncbi:unnamed protein product [Schistocephalus solidus]|uniref:DUF1758 domain-containing protein n=1 Tax=Schistocephalus solidus TaxID=70667 RepID=A0A183SRR8_SCHSO|nr:unnamed protein product [Schistocephalus solidus]